MSFINELSKMKEKMKTWNNANSSTTIDQINKLPKFLSVCTYSDEVRSIIENTVIQILNVFQDFNVQVLQFYDNATLFRFIQMKRQITVPFSPPLTMYLMFAPNFPKSPPFFRVVNPNPQLMSLKPMFLQSQSRNDPKSLILNTFLYEVRTWNPTKSVVNIIIQVNNLIRNNYPFQRIEQINQNFPLWGNNSNSPGRAVRNSPFNPSPSVFPNNPPPNNYFSSNLMQTIAKGQFYHGKQKQRLSKLSIAHTQNLSKIQAIDIIRISIQSQENYLSSENYKMKEIIKKQDSSIDLASIVRPSDANSFKILQYFSSVKARGNVETFLQKKFFNGEINLSDFMRLMRKNEEDKFVEKYILIKLINAQDEK